jgi:hypothetical protein
MVIDTIIERPTEQLNRGVCEDLGEEARLTDQVATLRGLRAERGDECDLRQVVDVRVDRRLLRREIDLQVE